MAINALIAGAGQPIPGAGAARGLRRKQDLDQRDFSNALAERGMSNRELQTQQNAMAQESEAETAFKRQSADYLMTLPEKDRAAAWEIIKEATVKGGFDTPELMAVPWSPEVQHKVFMHGTQKSANKAATRKLSMPNGMVQDQEQVGGEWQSVGEPYARRADSKGIRISPDGTVEIGGTPLDKANIRKTEEKVVSAGSSLARLATIKENYDPVFLTYAGKGKNWFLGIKDKAFNDLTPEERQFKSQYRRFTQGVNFEFNAYRKLITGAAASVQELESLKKAMISEDLSPAEFEAAYDEYVGELSRSIRINNKLLREGLKPGTKQFGVSMDEMFMGGQDDDIQARGDELEASGKSKDEVVEILEREGYF